MRPAKIARHTAALAPPPDWDPAENGHCGTLYVRGEQIDGVHFMRSAWDIEPHEAALMFAGAKLILGVAGSAHPVVHLAIESMPEDFEPFVTARRVFNLDGTPAARVEILYPNGGAPQRGFIEVQMEGRSFAVAVARGVNKIEKLAKQKGWIA